MPDTNNASVEKTKTIHIGLCMAGAVTAGAYTAGVLDVFFETMEKYQDQKVKPVSLVIDVISGASAGGMCTVIASYSLATGYYTKNRDKWGKKDSPLYKAWVDLADETGRDTLSKMLANDDLAEGSIRSVLNAKPLEDVSYSIITPLAKEEYPKYISEQLHLLLTVSNLDGVHSKVNMQGYSDANVHWMSQHRDLLHFQRGTGNFAKTAQTLDFGNPANLRQAALATGAFPIGLPAREITRPKMIAEAMAKKLLGNETSELNVLINGTVDSDGAIKTINSDGGMFNNEPFTETRELIKNSSGKKPTDAEIAIIMVDPFPSENPENFAPIATDLSGKPGELLGALRREALLKKEALKEMSGNELDFLIVPKLDGFGYKDGQKRPLCCGSVAAFGGFLSRNFREHDYLLGRLNAQAFLSKYFKIKLEDGSVILPLAEYAPTYSEDIIDAYKDLTKGKISGHRVIIETSTIIGLKSRLEKRFSAVYDALSKQIDIKKKLIGETERKDNEKKKIRDKAESVEDKLNLEKPWYKKMLLSGVKLVFGDQVRENVITESRNATLRYIVNELAKRDLLE